MSALTNSEAQDLLVGAVSIPSVSHDEGAVAAYLVERMGALGFQAHIDAAGNAVGEIGTGGRTIALVGHIDTVPGQIPVRVENGLLYGRGSVDAKGPFVSFIAAAARVAAVEPGLSLRVIGCVQEEAPSSAGARHLMGTPAPDALVIGEPSGWDGITLGYKGYLRARLKLSGDNAHTAHDVPTMPAQAARLWTRIEQAAATFDEGRLRVFRRLLTALLDMRCENDGQVARATLELTLRLPPDLPPADAEAWLMEHAGDAELEVLASMPAWTGPRTSFLHRALARGIRSHGAAPIWKEKTGTADLNLLAPAWGCPALAYGPGDAALDHTPNEHMNLDEFQRGISVLEHALVQCAGHSLAPTS
ncbi:MAG: LysW-gamma-L-lysine carboxypeptidase [Planctomycetota bacterium]|jgi:LysW-gamma-L-lysine carboxypeptidase